MNRTRKKVVPTGQPFDRRHPLETGEVRITTFVPLQFKRRGIKKVVVGPIGVDAPVKVGDPNPAISPNLDPTLLRALGRGLFWQHLLDKGLVAEWPRSPSGKVCTRPSSTTTCASPSWRLTWSMRPFRERCRAP